MTITERDPETGQIIKSVITSEEAKELQRLSRSRHLSEKARLLLESKGYNEDNPPPYYLELIAENASGDKSGKVPAMRDFLRLTSATVEQGGKVDLAPGETCSACGQRRGTDFITENDGEAAYTRVMEYSDVSLVAERGGNHASGGEQQD